MKNQPFSVHHLWKQEVMDAHIDKPLWSGKVAPFDESHRSLWRDWYRKWRPVIGKWDSLEHAYMMLDRKKNV